MRRQVLLIFVCTSCAAGASDRQVQDPAVSASSSASDAKSTPTSAPAAPASKSAADSSTPETLQSEAERLYKQAELEKENPGAWQEAGLALARASKAASDETREREFLRSALSAWQEVDRLLPAASARPSEQRTRIPRALPEWELSRLAVLARLAQLTPAGDPEATRIEYRRGRIFWNYDHHTEAAASFRLVIREHPESPEAEYATPLLLDTLALTQDLVGLHKELSSLLANKKLLGGRDELKSRMLLIRHQVDRKSSETLAQAQNYHGCAESYLALYKRDQQLAAVHADELLYNASVCLERAQEQARAIKVLRELVKKHPQSPFAAKAKERAEALSTSR